MTDTFELTDESKLRELFSYALRPSVKYTDGRASAAPLLVFADFDYEVGDGVCGLHADGKRANEPAIVYVRADTVLDALARAEAAEAEIDRLRDALASCRDEIDGYVRGEYPGDHPVQVRRRNRDLASNPARLALNTQEGGE